MKKIQRGKKGMETERVGERESYRGRDRYRGRERYRGWEILFRTRQKERWRKRGIEKSKELRFIW